MKNVDDTLNDRGQHYGDFARTFDVIQQIKGALKDGAGWADMPPERREALEMIAVKMGRLVSGDSGHADSWHDIAGYARLVEQSVLEKASPLEALKIPVRLVFDDEAGAVKKCVDCRSFVFVENPEKGMTYQQCRHPALVDPVDGSRANCFQVRKGSSSLHACGVEGRYFVERADNAIQR